MSFSQNLSFGGLGTFSFTAPSAGIYHFSGNSTASLGSAPGTSQPVPPSSVPAVGSAPNWQSVANNLVTTVKQNGTTIYTGFAGSLGFQTMASCALGDVMTIILSSSAACDQPINAIKSTIGIWS